MSWVYWPDAKFAAILSWSWGQGGASYTTFAALLACHWANASWVACEYVESGTPGGVGSGAAGTSALMVAASCAMAARQEGRLPAAASPAAVTALRCRNVRRVHGGITSRRFAHGSSSSGGPGFTRIASAGAGDNHTLGCGPVGRPGRRHPRPTRASATWHPRPRWPGFRRRPLHPAPRGSRHDGPTRPRDGAHSLLGGDLVSVPDQSLHRHAPRGPLGTGATLETTDGRTYIDMFMAHGSTVLGMPIPRSWRRP